ncbi:MAG: CHAT domain-containing protein [Pyrinomonadaceae bacterium]
MAGMLTHIARRTHKSYPFSHLIRHCFLLLLTYSLLVSTLAAQNDKDTPTLELGKPIERELAGGQSHSYRIALAKGEFLRVVVDQRGADVLVTLSDPAGKKLTEMDGLIGSRGPETVVALAESAGDYILEVRSLKNDPLLSGRYEARIEVLRPATERDRASAAAQRVSDEAAQVFSQPSQDIRTAFEKFEESRRLWEAAGEPSEQARSLLGAAQLSNFTGDYQRALELARRASQLALSAGDREMEGLALILMSDVHHSQGDYDQAMDLANRALKYAEATDNKEVRIILLRITGQILAERGQAQQALDRFDEALRLSRAVRDAAGEALSLGHIGGVYHSLGDYEKALLYYNQVVPFDREADPYRGLATTLSNIAAVQNAMGERQKAIENLNQALALSRAAQDPRIESVILNSLGVLYLLVGEKQKALDHAGQALEIATKIGDRSTEAVTLNNLGQIYGAAGDRAKALDHLRRALALWPALGEKTYEAAALATVADIERQHGNLPEALAHIERALSIIENLRASVVSQELRSSYFASVRDYYLLHVDVLMQLHRGQPAGGYAVAALQSAERARARSLLELLAESGADIRQGVDPALLEREGSLQRKLNLKARQQMLDGGDALKEEIEALTAEIQTVRAEIRRSSPRYAALTQPTPLTLREIQTQVLDDDTLLLEYSLGTDRSYLWAVTSTSITSYELPKREEIETSARRFYELITVPPRQAASAAPEKRETGEASQPQDGTQLMQAAADLSRMLLAPVAPLLGKKRLLIVGDGALQYIPFAALPTLPVGVGRAATKPLIVEHEIVNLSSASTLAVLRREMGGRKPAPKTLAVLADPVFERSDERFKARVGKKEASDPRSNARSDELLGRSVVAATSARQSGVADAGLRIRRLPGTRREADEIVKFVPPANYKKALDFAANRVTATGPDLGQYRYVHFATHGFLNSQHPELSGIVLSMFDEQGAPEDGFLRAHEVFNLKLNADVVVLSACQTGLGKEIKGEGLVGLTRGFMYAGAPRVVVSLWNVNDAATAELMTRFYRGMLVDKLRPARALQAAQVSMLNERQYSEPFYWAAFTLQGEWR